MERGIRWIKEILISLDDLIELQKEIDEAYEMALKNQAK